MQQSGAARVFEDMLGTSPQMQGVFSFIRKVAATTAPVLLLGESGTGKEMAALAIHRRSSRKDGPFIPINCNAIPENLLESELFGHEKGAFTGAHMQRKGLIESASGGTFSSMKSANCRRDPGETAAFSPGATISAGRRPAGDPERCARRRRDQRRSEEGITEGKFREDLYFRLAVVVIKLPPLRERGDDVLVLAQRIPAALRRAERSEQPDFRPRRSARDERHPWPGNVRELQNRIKRAVIMADGKRITEHDLELTSAGGTRATLKEVRESVERDLVQQALRRHFGKISSAAAELGVSRPTLYELMEKLGLHKREPATET